MSEPECCEMCDDGDGHCAYPMYGVAPHTCYMLIPGACMGESVELPESEWPSIFVLDPESGPPRANGVPRCGTYTKCTVCGRPYS